MKNYIIYLISILAVSLLLSCDRGGEPELGNNTLRLTLACTDITRATEVGDDDLNENKLISIDCFFYAAGADFNTPALARRTISSINASGIYSTYISFEEDEIKEIFGDLTGKNSASCLIYVIANRPSGVALPDGNPTIKQLKSLTIESDFQEYAEPQSSFVMDSKGDDVVSLVVNSNGTKTLSATVPLYRTAAKISFSISGFGEKATEGSEESGDGSVVINGQTYTPNYEGIYVILNRAVTKSHIGPELVSNSNIEERFCNVGDDDGVNKIRMVTTNGLPFTLEMPFYSYPSDWNANTGNNDSYISLVVPWETTKTNSDNTKTTTITPYHYKVPINYNGDKIERNTHYKISVQISILGTVDPEAPITIDPSYVVFDCLNDWNSDPINATITDFHYLMVEENSYVMNNVDEIKIPYWTSHPCVLETLYVQQLNLLTNTKDPMSRDDYTLELRDGYIYFEHVLHNSFEDDKFDFAPCEIKFRIKHTEAHNEGSEPISEEITIIQYPALYGESYDNTDATNGNDNNANKGFVWVNGYQGTSVSGSGMNRYTTSNNGNIVKYFDGANGNSIFANRSMLVFSISSVEGTDYVIGDPREETVNNDFVGATHTVNNNLHSIWDKAPVVGQKETRTLQYYYATDVNHENLKSLDGASTTPFYRSEEEAERNERTYNMIAPKFRVASAYGMFAFNTDVHNYYHIVKKRCASYQEDGYPAGRWRLPTKAEFEFIIYLSAQGKIPELFYDGYYYWCAHGYGVPDIANKKVNMTYTTQYTGSSRISVRCVYDDWYWGSDRVTEANATDVYPNGRFVWGDVNRVSYAPPMNY